MKDECFFCCESIINLSCCQTENQNHVGEVKRAVRFSISQISAYLRNFCCDTMDTSKIDIVSLCQDCGVIADKLTNYCGELEVTQMWITYLLQQLNMRMDKATGSIGENAFNGNQLYSVGDKDDVTGELDCSLGRYRNLFKERCTLKLQSTSVPQVHLRRSDENKISPEAVDTNGLILEPTPPTETLTFYANVKVEVEDAEEQWIKNELADLDNGGNEIETGQEDYVDVIGVEDVDIGKKEVKPTERESPTELNITCDVGGNNNKRAKAHKESLNCPYCNVVVCDTTQLRLHTTVLHAEQFLFPAKKDHVTMDQFKVMCQKVIRKEKRISTELGQQPKFGCIYCDITYSAAVYVQSHLIGSHADVLTRKLEKLQTGTAKDVGRKVSEIISDMPKSLVRVRNFGKRKQQFSYPPKLKPTNHCNDCGKIFLNPCNIRRHKTRNCKGQKNVVKRGLNAATVTPKKHRVEKLKVTCQDCGDVVVFANLRYHKLFYCEKEANKDENELVEKYGKSEAVAVIPPPDAISWECSLCKKAFLSLEDMESHNEQDCSKAPKAPKNSNKFRCSICKTHFPSKINLTVHKARKHPATLLSCPNCAKRFVNSSYLKTHIKFHCSSIPK